jgi:hypothetical protein
VDKKVYEKTTAFRVVRQLIDHSWGNDTELNSRLLTDICKAFYDAGGSWERLVDGDPECFRILDAAIKNHLDK